jgi:hypothetical protein
MIAHVSCLLQQPSRSKVQAQLHRARRGWFSLQKCLWIDSSIVLLVCRIQIEAQEQQVRPGNWR